MKHRGAEDVKVLEKGFLCVLCASAFFALILAVRSRITRCPLFAHELMQCLD